MEACPKVMWHDEEMISTRRPVPIGPVRGDELNCTPHDARRLEGQRMAPRSKVTGRVHRSVEPVGLLRVHGPHRARQQELVHEDLRRKHVVEAPVVLFKKVMVVLPRHLVDEHLELPDRVVFQHIAGIP